MPPCQGQVLFTGHVVDENGAPVAQARVAAQTVPYAPQEASTGPSGAFEISLAAPGAYQVTVERAGFFRLAEAVDVQAEGADLTLVLNPQREVFQSVEVGELPTPVDPAQTDQQQHLSGTEINDIPYPSSHSLRNAMKLMPGVIAGSLRRPPLPRRRRGPDALHPERFRYHRPHRQPLLHPPGGGGRARGQPHFRPRIAAVRRRLRRHRSPSRPITAPTSSNTPPPISFPAWTPAAACTSAIGRRARAFPAPS